MVYTIIVEYIESINKQYTYLGIYMLHNITCTYIIIGINKRVMNYVQALHIYTLWFVAYL